jgi:hypothetical protein
MISSSGHSLSRPVQIENRLPTIVAAAIRPATHMRWPAFSRPRRPVSRRLLLLSSQSARQPRS